MNDLRRKTHPSKNFVISLIYCVISIELNDISFFIDVIKSERIVRRNGPARRLLAKTEMPGIGTPRVKTQRRKERETKTQMIREQRIKKPRINARKRSQK